MAGFLLRRPKIRARGRPNRTKPTPKSTRIECQKRSTFHPFSRRPYLKRRGHPITDRFYGRFFRVFFWYFFSLCSHRFSNCISYRIFRLYDQLWMIPSKDLKWNWFFCKGSSFLGCRTTCSPCLLDRKPIFFVYLEWFPYWLQFLQSIDFYRTWMSFGQFYCVANLVFRIRLELIMTKAP